MERNMVIDPVCHMEVDPERSAGHRRVGDRVYHFCSTFCVNRFDVRPERYAPVGEYDDVPGLLNSGSSWSPTRRSG